MNNRQVKVKSSDSGKRWRETHGGLRAIQRVAEVLGGWVPFD